MTVLILRSVDLGLLVESDLAEKRSDGQTMVVTILIQIRNSGGKDSGGTNQGEKDLDGSDWDDSRMVD